MIRRAIGLTLGDWLYDREQRFLAAICYFYIAQYPRMIELSRTRQSKPEPKPVTLLLESGNGFEYPEVSDIRLKTTYSHRY